MCRFLPIVPYIIYLLFQSYFDIGISRELHVQYRHLIPALNAWEARVLNRTTRPIATQFPGHEFKCDLPTERSFESLMCLAYFFMLSMDVCTARHWQASGQLGQESNVCTVYWLLVPVKKKIEEGGRTFVTYFAEEGVFFKTSACPRFCKRRVLFCTQVQRMGVKIPLQSTKYTRL